MSEPLIGEELELFRINFVEKLKEPMRADFRRVVDTIVDLERQLAGAQGKLEAVQRELDEVEANRLPRLGLWFALDRILHPKEEE